MFKKIKSLFIVEAEGSSTANESKPVQAVKSGNTSDINSAMDSRSLDVSKKGVEKFVNLLLKALEEAGQDGFDYLEFKDSIKSLEGISMDEGTKYKSALAMAKTMGADGSSLESSAKYYINVLLREKEKINDAYTQKLKSDKEESEDQIRKINNALTQKTAQLKKLEEELKMHKTELEKLQKEKLQSEQKANTIKSEFDKAYQLINGQIEDDLKNLEKYLK